jgi:DNA-binding NarL/FixJ family response regulator
MPLNQGLFHLAHGRFLRELGERQAAVRELRAAHEIFLRLQARPFAEQSEQELIACRLRSGASYERDPLGLTGQELAVARLVAAGKRNREVASELYVTTKTIEYHLANVYAKLGVTNRAELAARFSGAVPRLL